MKKQFLITVGTTKFEKLIMAIDNEEFYNLLDENGFTNLIIQKGFGDYTPNKFKNLIFKNLFVNVETLLSDFENIIKNSEFIISHAGAGNILEALKYKKKLFVAVNDLLMDNHQVELAEALKKDNYIFYISQLDNKVIYNMVKNVLENENKFKLDEYPNFNTEIIPNLIYEMLDI